MSYLDGQSGTEKSVDDDVLLYIAKSTSGDVRHAIGVLENAYFSAENEITREVVDEFNVGIGNFDTDTHFDLLSCLQKSISILVRLVKFDRNVSLGSLVINNLEFCLDTGVHLNETAAVVIYGILLYSICTCLKRK